VTSAKELPAADAVLFDTGPRTTAAIMGAEMPDRYRRKLERYRYGAAAFKVDWALTGPVPWKSERARQAGTVHIGGTIEEVAAAERDVYEGRAPERPFILIGQQSLFDATRAPVGQHTLWGYCHVPNGCTVDMTERIEAQLERFAPGFRDLVIARNVRFPADIAAHNENCVGGDIAGGATNGLQLVMRPTARLDPYRIPGTNAWLCSASTPPGGGTHGMCGYNAATAVLRRHRSTA